VPKKKCFDLCVATGAVLLSSCYRRVGEKVSMTPIGILEILDWEPRNLGIDWFFFGSENMYLVTPKNQMRELN